MERPKAEELGQEREKKMNNELLAQVQILPASALPEKKPKRNSKEDLTQKILQVVDKYQLDFDHSDTKLKRMSKVELQQLLAKVMEQCVKIDMAKAAGVDPRSNGRVITMGALRMIHNLAATGFERVYNGVGARFTGYEIEGFSESLREPMIAESVDECLAEIAKDNPEVLEYFDSPYTRLLLVWTGALLTCIKKKGPRTNKERNGVHRMGPAPNQRPGAPGPSGGRGAEVRQVDEHSAPSVPNVGRV